MPRLLDALSRPVTRHPALSIALLVLVTVGLGSFAMRLEQSTSFESFSSGSAASRTLEVVTSEFGTGGDALQVLLDAGAGGNVLDADALDELVAVEDTVASTLGERAASPDQAMVSYSNPIRAALARLGTSLDEADPDTLRGATGAVLESPGASQLAGLLSADELDASQPSSRAGLGIVTLAADLDEQESIDASLDVRDALDELEPDTLQISVVGQPLLEQASAELTSSELPRLLGISLLLITIVLALVFRRLSDVVIGLVGLALALVWTYGLGALLGPGWLGLTGPFNQITTVVPILVAGLGIDFALHLTIREREERAEHRPRRAASLALVTVGGALVLTTVTTAVGFLTNLASPLPPIRDFGVFTAVGVLSAFIVMIVLVPASRTMLDRIQERRADGDGSGAAGRSSAAMPGVGPASRLAIAHPVAVLATTVLITLAAVVAGLSVPTTFSTDDFVPSGSRAASALEEIEQLFGSDVSERTYVLLDGPLTDPAAANAVADLSTELADLEGVRSAAGDALVQSPVSLVAQSAAASPQLAERLDALGWTGSAFAEDARVAQVYDAVEQVAPDRAARVLAPEGDRQLLELQTSVGQDGAADLADRLDERLDELHQAGVDTRITSQQLIFADTVDALTDSQLRSIGITLLVAALLLVAYFRVREQTWALGPIAMLPTVLVATWVVGSMWVLGLSFNVLTITIGSLAIAIGVDYGIHIAYRFREEHEQRGPSDAIQHTMEQTGGALAGSAATTAVGFGVLMFSSILPIRQFGIITALTIVYSVVAAVVVMPAVLQLWSRRSGGTDGHSSEHQPASPTPELADSRR